MQEWAIAIKEGDRIYYWQTRYGGTDNYTNKKEDATSFCDKVFATALMYTLNLQEDNIVIKLAEY